MESSVPIVPMAIQHLLAFYSLDLSHPRIQNHKKNTPVQHQTALREGIVGNGVLLKDQPAVKHAWHAFARRRCIHFDGDHQTCQAEHVEFVFNSPELRGGCSLIKPPSEGGVFRTTDDTPTPPLCLMTRILRSPREPFWTFSLHR